MSYSHRQDETCRSTLFLTIILPSRPVIDIGSQLDWFHFETKMRALVRDLLTPVQKKAEEDKKQYLIVTKRQEEH